MRGCPKAAVQAGSRGLAKALSGLLCGDEPPAPLELMGHFLLRRGGSEIVAVEPGALDALELSLIHI
eukprot:5271742-Alexandrium_andersonii.AAC.1